VSEEKRRAEILKAREENKRLAEMILQGTAYHEPVQVRGIDGQQHTFQVFPLSDGDLAALLASTGIDLRDIGDREKLVSNLKFLQEAAALCTGVPDIGKALMPMESLRLILKSFELSGLSSVPKPD